MKMSLNQKAIIKARRAYEKPNAEEKIWANRLYPSENVHSPMNSNLTLITFCDMLQLNFFQFL